MRPNQWWQFGLIGGSVLTIATATKLASAVIRGTVGTVEWGETGGFAAAIFGMGFVCGVIIWAGRGLSQRFGPVGDAVIGLVVMEAFFVSCMLLFQPEMLGSKFENNGLPMLGFAVPLGLFAGWLIGRDFRPQLTAEQRRRRKFLEELEDESAPEKRA